jgi:hypothetical protein
VQLAKEKCRVLYSCLASFTEQLVAAVHTTLVQYTAAAVIKKQRGLDELIAVIDAATDLSIACVKQCGKLNT